MKAVLVTKEIAESINELKRMTNGFQYEMYCIMNKYIFNQSSDYRNPLLEPLRKCNLFEVVDAIRYGYRIV